MNSRGGPFLSFTRPENDINYSSEKVKGSADVENIGPLTWRPLKNRENIRVLSIINNWLYGWFTSGVK